MDKCALLIAMLFLITGCSYTNKPDQDAGFTGVRSLSDFDGCYENCSDTSDGSAMTCLSGTIWPGEFSADNLPDEVSVRANDGATLTVSAYRDGSIVKESIFQQDKHFHFKDGRIELKREYIASGAREPGNVFIGLATGQTVLGLDAEGEGRVQQSVAFAGTAFLVIPIAAAGSDISKIRRKALSCNEH